jgi:hypothetical protein
MRGTGGQVFTVRQYLDDVLPPQARRKYEALAAAVDEHRAMMRLMDERMAPKAKQLAIWQAQIAGMDARYVTHDTSTQATIANLRSEADALEADIALLDQKRAKHANAGRAADQALTNLRDNFLPAMIMGNVGPWRGPLRMVERETARPRDGETLLTAIRRVRNGIAEIKGKLGLLAQLPPSEAEIEAHIDRYVAELKQRGQPMVQFGANGEMRITMPDVLQAAASGAALSCPSGAAGALLAARDPAGVKALLMAAVPRHHEGVSAEDRAMMRDAYEAQLIELERDDEDLTAQALDAGLDGVARRPDASGWAVLGLTVEALPVAPPDISGRPERSPVVAVEAA